MSGFGDIKELLQDAKNLATGGNDLQLKSKLLEIQTNMYELLEENKELRLALEEEKRNKEISIQIVHKDNAYFYKEDGPYCTRCWDVDKRLVRINKTQIGMEMRQGNYKCPNCKVIV